jgi:hypothetical protein
VSWRDITIIWMTRSALDPSAHSCLSEQDQKTLAELDATVLHVRLVTDVSNSKAKGADATLKVCIHLSRFFDPKRENRRWRAVGRLVGRIGVTQRTMWLMMNVGPLATRNERHLHTLPFYPPIRHAHTHPCS